MSSNEHVPVLLGPVLDGLSIKADGTYVDGTFGRGGHSKAILERLNANGVPSAKVASVADLVDDEHLAHRGQIINMEHAKAGTVPMQGFTVKFGESPMRLRHPPPLLGEHSNAILNEWLAFSEDQVSQLREDGII